MQTATRSTQLSRSSADRTPLNRAALRLVFGITLMVTMGISSILPVLPQMAHAFGIPVEGSWRIIAAFALPGLVFIPFVGVLADRYGRKRVLVPALVLFALGGVACMVAQSYAELLFWRIVQGAGSAPLGLLYNTIIADTWEGEDRVRAMSANAMVLGLGTAASPALGGALGMLHWKLPFVLPLCALGVALMAARTPLKNPGAETGLREYFRATLSCIGERRTLALLGMTLLTFIMLSGPIITCFPMLAELAFKASPLESGCIIAAASLAAGLAAWTLPRLYRRFSTRALLLAAMALYAVAFAAISLTPSLWLLVVPIAVYGFAQGLNIPLVSTLLTGQAPDAQRASLMAANAILLRLGQNIGPSVFGTLAALYGPGTAIALGGVVALAMAALTAVTPLPQLDGLEDAPSAQGLP